MCCWWYGGVEGKCGEVFCEFADAMQIFSTAPKKAEVGLCLWAICAELMEQRGEWRLVFPCSAGNFLYVR